MFVTFVTVDIKLQKMNKRLQQFLNAESISQTQLADTMKVTRAGVSHIISGRNRPGFDFLESLVLHYPELNLDWLITGRGKMYKKPENHDSPDEQLKPSKRIAKVVVFYDDNSFDEII